VKDIASDPETQAAFVHGMMFATTLAEAGLNVGAIGEHLCKVWNIGDPTKTAKEYGEKIEAILLARPI